MTSQTKKFIELSDIIALHLECKQCSSSLSVLIDRENGALENLLSQNNKLLAACPTCQFEWTEFTNSSVFDSEVKKFFRTLRDLKQVVSRFGCLITLEIKEETISRQGQP